MNLQELPMNRRPRKHLHLNLNDDQFDDLISALDSHRDCFRRLSEEAANGFGLGIPYWDGRVNEIQELIDAVRHCARGAGAE